MSEKNYFIENAFGDVYAGTFFADDFPQAQPKNSVCKNKTVDEIKVDEATSKVRYQNEVDVSRQVNQKINSVYSLGGDLGNISLLMSQGFSGRILGGI